MLGKLVEEVQASAKYRDVSPDLIRRIGAKEVAARRNVKEAIKATKNTLHQIGGAFLDRAPRYERWLTEIQQSADVRDVCRSLMDNHASTRERLPMLESFYNATLAKIQPVRSVLDLCCGLNPLAIPWMPLAPEVTYYACDIYGDMMAFLNRFFALTGIDGDAQVCDLGTAVPQQPVQLALLLKALPPLEQTDKAASLRLLQSIPAEHLLVSFPTRTLGGRNKQMAEHYETRFRALIAGETWDVERFEFGNELCFLVSR